MSDIVVANANKSFGAHHILRDISLTVSSGEFVVLLGSSGCGKSTLLNVIAGLEELDTGRVVVAGRDVTGVEPSQRNMAMVFQSYALYPTMTVRKNLSFGLRVNRTPKAEIRARVAWAANLLQIEPLLDRRPAQLSGGQRQRVAIGRALVKKSPICLFDEPLSNLDAKLRTEMRLEIKKLHHELQSTVIYVTHDQIEAMTLATRVAVMKSGKVEQYATPSELYEKPETLFVAGFVGSPAMNLLPARLAMRDSRIGAEIGDGFIDLGRYPFRETPVIGTEIVLGLRPEEIGIRSTGAGQAALPSTFMLSEPMGADTLAWFSAFGEKLSVRLPAKNARQLQGQVDLVFDAATASVFSAVAERRL